MKIMAEVISKRSNIMKGGPQWLEATEADRKELMGANPPESNDGRASEVPRKMTTQPEEHTSLCCFDKVPAQLG